MRRTDILVWCCVLLSGVSITATDRTFFYHRTQLFDIISVYPTGNQQPMITSLSKGEYNQVTITVPGYTWSTASRKRCLALARELGIDLTITGEQLLFKFRPEKFQVSVWTARPNDRFLAVYITINKPVIKQWHCGTWQRAHKIVIDAGHGGDDRGGFVGSVYEKDIALNAAKLLQTELRKRGFEVIMTRLCDAQIPLDRRTAIANSANADLCISLHTNFSSKQDIHGFEIYTPSFRYAQRLYPSTDTLFESCTLERGRASAQLASALRTQLSSCCNNQLTHRRTEGATFQVLTGTSMPTVIVELGFLSNAQDYALLTHTDSLHKIVQSIADGIEHYRATGKSAVGNDASKRKAG